MPILWNAQNCHLLRSNFNLCRTILQSSLKKLIKNRDHLSMVDDVIKTQLKCGIIQKVEIFPDFLVREHNCSFLAHMPVFGFDKETTSVD